MILQNNDNDSKNGPGRIDRRSGRGRCVSEFADSGYAGSSPALISDSLFS